MLISRLLEKCKNAILQRMAAGGKHSDPLNENSPSGANSSGEQFREALDFSDSASFSAAVRDLIELAGEFKAVDVVRKAAQQDQRGVPILVELLRLNSQNDKFGRVIFHAARTQNPEILRSIRETWAEEADEYVLRRLHMCMMDCIGSHENDQDRLSPVANEEIPEWLAMLDSQNPHAQGLIIWLVAALSRHALQYVDKVRSLATEAAASPDQSAHMAAQRALQILSARDTP
jgi:hypothetical protein